MSHHSTPWTVMTISPSNNISTLPPEPSINSTNTTSTSFFGNTSDSNGSGIYNHHSAYLILIIIPVWIVLGNLLVIIAIARDRKLRTVTNQMVVSLAISDLLIGVTAVPLTIMYLVLGRWPLGRAACHFFHSCDVFASTASILNLVAISLDRYWAVSHPISYPRIMSKRRAYMSIATVWILSAAIAFPVIAWWDAVDPVTADQCYFTEVPTYLLLSSAVSFYIPSLIMIFVYIRIFMIIRRQSQKYFGGDTNRQRTSSSCHGDGSTRRYSDVMLRAHRGGVVIDDSQTPLNSKPSFTAATGNLPSIPDSPMSETTLCRDLTQLSLLQIDTPTLNSRRPSVHSIHSQCSVAFDSCHQQNGFKDNNGFSPLNKLRNGTLRMKSSSSSADVKRSRMSNEVKVARTLALVLGLFLICWLPFFLTNVVFALCKTCVSYDFLFQIVTWLGYINSGINPVIYALSMKNLRAAFTDILCYFFRKKSIYGAKTYFVADTIRVITASFQTKS